MSTRPKLSRLRSLCRSTPLQWNHFPTRGRGGRAELRPGLHQPAPPLDRSTAGVGAFGLVLVGVCERKLSDFTRKVRLFAAPISEGAAEAVHREAPANHAAHEF